MSRLNHPRAGGNIDPSTLFGALVGTDVTSADDGFTAVDRASGEPRRIGPVASLADLERLVAFRRRVNLTTFALGAPPALDDDPGHLDPATHVRDLLSALEPLTPASAAELRRILLDAFESDYDRREVVSQALMSCGLAIEEVR